MPRRRSSLPVKKNWRVTDPVLCVQHLQSGELGKGLQAIQALLDFITEHEERLVRRARENGWSWHNIAFEMGVSYQSVHRKWRRRIHGTQFDPNSSRRKDKWIEKYGPS